MTAKPTGIAGLKFHWLFAWSSLYVVVRKINQIPKICRPRNGFYHHSVKPPLLILALESRGSHPLNIYAQAVCALLHLHDSVSKTGDSEP